MSKPARCPSCKGPVPDGSATRPFCSERCRMIDLGNWLDGRYRIAGEKHLDEQGPPPVDSGDPDA